MRDNHQSAMYAWRVIYPRGDRSRLDVACVVYYEVNEWDIASRQEFVEEESAIEYMKTLAKENGLLYEGQNNNHFLD